MTFLDELKEARESAASSYHHFLLEYPKYPKDIFAFFEGKDDPSFYSGFIYSYMPKNKQLHVFRCGKKKHLYETFDKVQNSPFNKSINLFFADKDHSDLLGDTFTESKNIYVTDYYSIENYLVDEHMFLRLLVDICHLDNCGLNFGDIQHKFIVELNNFYNGMKNVCIWFLVLLSKGEKPHYNNVRIADICSFSRELTLTVVDEKTCIKLLEKMCDKVTPSDFKPMKTHFSNKLKEYEPKKYVRGKFELWFLIEFLNCFIASLRKSVLKPEDKLRISTQINHNNAIEILGPRVKLPDSLKQFLTVNLQS